FWGYLISRDQPTQPTPLFRRLLGAIADYIENMAPKEIRTLTPAKLAAFYKEVGGDLDELFLGTPAAKLSDIYSTLGCAHSLQPVPGDDFIPPSIPALSQRGFACWQTIQLLLDPEEHVPYIQEAVRNFMLRDPETGEPFPREIPAEAFPRYTDVETERWHNE
ncbi:hypothetical protein BZA05DRAFT_321982, partial [Tricharina praecox]|uniref:uncharacterized protein n=1 Tax=Tricharina praecox TaxID=43433 RepID=UPI00221E7465